LYKKRKNLNQPKKISHYRDSLFLAFVDKNSTQAATIAVATTVNTCMITHFVSTYYHTKTSQFAPAQTYQLRPRPTLHQSLSPRIPRHSLNIIIQARRETRYRQTPEHEAKRQRDPLLQWGGFGFEVEGDEDGDGDDGHVGCEAEPGEECCVLLDREDAFLLLLFGFHWALGAAHTAFCGAVVPSIGVVVIEEQGA
jgi:hypothetical protein